jgi:hypothetical protein
MMGLDRRSASVSFPTNWKSSKRAPSVPLTGAPFLARTSIAPGSSLSRRIAHPCVTSLSFVDDHRYQRIECGTGFFKQFSGYSCNDLCVGETVLCLTGSGRI